MPRTFQKVFGGWVRGAIELKNVPKSGKSGKSPKGEGSANEIKKFTIQNVDFLTRGGGPYLHFFPNVNADLNASVEQNISYF